jgi:hypothetical protein
MIEIALSSCHWLRRMRVQQVPPRCSGAEQAGEDDERPAEHFLNNAPAPVLLYLPVKIDSALDTSSKDRRLPSGHVRRWRAFLCWIGQARRVVPSSHPAHGGGRSSASSALREYESSVRIEFALRVWSLGLGLGGGSRRPGRTHGHAGECADAGAREMRVGPTDAMTRNECVPRAGAPARACVH